jgi:endonuclease/exonuclease/phosphatase family metal-dependent hydrolase
MPTQIRIITANLCNENPGNKTTLIKKWFTVFSKLNVDILFLQEIATYNIETLANKLDMKIFNVNQFEETSLLINPDKLSIIDNNYVKLKTGKKPIYIGGIHLDDVPSLPHHMNNMTYKSYKTYSLSNSIDKMLTLCEKHRMPKVKEEFKKIKNIKTDRIIIAGDFNEPSHLDLDNDIKTPISIEFEKNGFVDTYRHMNKNTNTNMDTNTNKNKNIDKSKIGYTWPVGKYYKGEPEQRIDFIYTKNLKIVKSVLYDGDDGGTTNSKWLSDHRIVITDIVI